VSWYPQLKTGIFCRCKLHTCHCWWQYDKYRHWTSVLLWLLAAAAAAAAAATTTTTTTTINKHFMALCPRLPGWAGTRKKHSLNDRYPDHQSSFICFLHLPQSIAPSCSSLHLRRSHSYSKPDSLFAQPLYKSSLVYLLVWYPPLHTPYISSPNHYLLFATHAHTIATCFAIVLRLCHLILFLSQLFTWNSIFYLNVTHSSDHSHLCLLKCHLIFFFTGQVSLPYNILFHTQLLYSLPLIINDISFLVSNTGNKIRK